PAAGECGRPFPTRRPSDLAQQARYQQLQGEFDELRSRPEKVRTVVRKVEVRADDTCRSLPREWMRLWNADADSVRPVPAATATSDRKSTRLNSSHVKISYA